MGSAGHSKKAPAKKANKAKPNRGAKSHKDASNLAAASVSVAPHLCVPTNLPLCVLDNGGWTVKYGLVPSPPADAVRSNCAAKADGREGACGGERSASVSNVAAINKEHGSDDVQMSCMYNATARPPHQLAVLAGDEITARMKNLGQLSWNSPLERGMICNGETQLRVWARVLEVLGVVPVPMPAMGSGRMASGGFLATVAAARGAKPFAAAGGRKETISSNHCSLLLLTAPFEPSVISEGVDLMLFRELGMARVARMLGPCMAAVRYLSTVDDDANNKGWINDNTKCCCVVDSGHSFTHVVPTHHGEAVSKAIRRLNIGGKVLTNLLKETVTYRQWNMMDEYHIVNDAKEKLCFVTDKFEEEMKQARLTRKGLRWFDREYLLPDFLNTFQGSVRLPEPLQRKREAQEMEHIEKEMARLNNEKEKQELEKEVEDLSDMQCEAGCETDEAKPENGGLNAPEDRQGRETPTMRKLKKENKRKKHKTARQENTDVANSDNDNDSDEETDQQRLQRMKAMREAERKRREQESLERQALAMSVERFAVPEVLFRPSDIGLNCGGVAEAIVESIEACDPMLRAALYHNILLVGGNVKIPGFKERLKKQLRELAPTNYEVRVYSPEDPIGYAWEGAKQFSRQPDFQERFSIDRLSWEAMKKMGMTQREIWDKKMFLTPRGEHVGI